MVIDMINAEPCRYGLAPGEEVKNIQIFTPH